MSEYYWQDDDEQVFVSPLVNHKARGKCSGIPACCVAWFETGGERDVRAWDWGYVACPACAVLGNRVEVRHCADLKDSCTCGQWAERKPA